MQLGGFSRLTLQDFPGRVAAICFTPGCQLRCPYCHNAELVLSDGQDFETRTEKTTNAFSAYLRQRRSQLDGIVVSGGEPLLQHDVGDFLREVKALGLDVKLDTNGMLPDKLADLIQQNLVDYVALDYKNCRQALAATVGLDPSTGSRAADKYYDSWWASLRCLRDSYVPYEIRTTVVRELHPLEALKDMASAIGNNADRGEQWFLQPFVQNGPLMSSLRQDETRLSPYTDAEMQAIRTELAALVPGIQCR